MAWSGLLSRQSSGRFLIVKCVAGWPVCKVKRVPHIPVWGNICFGVLLAAGARVNAVSRQGNTPLHLAGMNGHAVTVQVLLAAGARAGMANLAGSTPLELATCSGHTETVKLLAPASAGPAHSVGHAGSALLPAGVFPQPASEQAKAPFCMAGTPLAPTALALAIHLPLPRSEQLMVSFA